MAAWEYDNFDLLIETEDDGQYRARVVESPTGETPANVFRIPFEPTHLENLLLKLDPGRSGTRRVAADPQSQAALELGGGLFEAVFSSDLRLTWARSMDAVRAEKRGLRLRLRLTDAPAIAALPWELLYDRRQASYLAQSERTPVVRYLDTPFTPRPLDVDGALRVLVILSSPTDLPELDVESEWRRVQQAMAERVADGSVRLDRLPEPTVQSLSTWIRRHDVNVLHFVGHGEYDRQIESGVLFFCDRYGRRASVPAAALGPYLRDHDPLRLVFLNACQSARVDSSDPFSGLAQGLVQQDCVAVVAMQFPISDGAAAEFTGEFYGSLADGLAVDQSVTSARKALLAGYASEWATPVLFLRAPDGRVFEHIHPVPEPTGAPVASTQSSRAAVDSAAVPVVTAAATTAEVFDTAQTRPEPSSAPSSAAPAASASAPAAPAAPASPPPHQDPAEVLAALRTPKPERTESVPEVAEAQIVPAPEAATLGAAATGPPTPPTPARVPTLPSPPQPTGRVAGRIAAVVLVLILLGGLAWWYSQRPNTTPEAGDAPIASTSSQPTSESAAVVSHHVTVLGNQAWTDAGVECQPGKTVEMVATGTVVHDISKHGTASPDGDPNPNLRQFNLPGLPDANHSALVASLDKKAPLTVVGSSATYQCSAAGELYLGPNDGGVDNNSGEWSVTVTPSG